MMVGQEGQRLGAKGLLKNRLFLLGQVEFTINQRPQRCTAGLLFGWLQPIPLALEGIGGQE